MMQWETADRL